MKKKHQKSYQELYTIQHSVSRVPPGLNIQTKRSCHHLSNIFYPILCSSHVNVEIRFDGWPSELTNEEIMRSGGRAGGVLSRLQQHHSSPCCVCGCVLCCPNQASQRWHVAYFTAGLHGSHSQSVENPVSLWNERRKETQTLSNFFTCWCL